MSKSKSRRKKTPKRILALRDLEHAKTAVLNSLTSGSGQRTYDHATREFVAWYCFEPCLAFNRGDPAGDCCHRLRAYPPRRAVRFLLVSPSIRVDDDRGDRIRTMWDTRGFAAHW